MAKEAMPSLPHRAWNLTVALAQFAADGCHVISEAEYRARLEVCDTCEHRSWRTCVKCGCNLAMKAKGRAWRCPLGKWTNQVATPVVRDAPQSAG